MTNKVEVRRGRRPARGVGHPLLESGIDPVPTAGPAARDDSDIMAIRITCYGAAGEVTGSAYHVQTEQANLLIDFGMFQGGRAAEVKNRKRPGFEPRRLDAVLLTHAHLDHCGRLPLLVQRGFQGPIYCTPATIEVAALILRDSAKVQAYDLVRTNRKRQRAGRPALEALYTASDVETVLGRFQPVPYDDPVPVAPGVRARFVEAGHLLGSASIQLLIESSNPTAVVFSGDLGQKGAPILKDPVGFQRANLVLLESTYGDHDHKPLEETAAEFERIVRQAAAQRGKILVPTFAVGRAQLLLYLLALMFRHGVVPKFPVFVDSPMAIEATRIYWNHLELFDEEFQALRKERPLQADMDTVRPTATADESKALNDQPGPCLILAGAGMCNAGRILHHLKQNLWRPETSVIIVGYQANGTLGRQLVERQPKVSIFGDKIAVKAAVHTLGGFSAHAGQSDLLRWFEPMAGTQPRLALIHGEPRARATLARLLEERHGIRADLPEFGQVLAAG